MIDDQKEVRELIQAMKDQLPIPARATPALAQSFRQRGTAIEANQSVQIDSVLNLGDEGGIGCGLGIFGRAAVIVSITRLRFEAGHPLTGRIRAYQARRSQRIGAPLDRSSRPSQKQLAAKLKQYRKSQRRS